MRVNTTTTIDLIRHGEPEGGTRFRGWQNDPLSERGWSQMRETVGDHAPWRQIISSPLLRCADFAAELSNRLELPMTTEHRLQELGFGEWEGRRAAELYRESPEAVGNFWSDPVAYPPPGGEPFDKFHSRVMGAWEDIQSDHQGSHLLIVAHGGVNRMIIGQVLGMPLSHLFRMDIPYAGISRICIDDCMPRLAFHCGTLIQGSV
ncbi:MAG: alpha-ribazole phosphatase family protein [Sedimenticola sp.]